MKLYKIHVYLNDNLKGTFFVITRTEAEASDLVMKKWHEWDYWKDAYVNPGRTR